jgi:phosphoesterase RecJ-like protein
MLEQIAELVRKAETIVLSTHRQGDGDGLGAQLAFFHALKKIGKRVRVLNVDLTPRRYQFLGTDAFIQAFETEHEPLGQTDLALIFDTNDHRLVEPLFPELQKQCKRVVFIDHHPALLQGPQPTVGSYINTKAASTGELVYQLIRMLGIELDANICRALYTSLVFDTQLFRYVRNSATSHIMAADILRFEKAPEDIHRYLFGNYTHRKVAFLAKALGEIEYFAEAKIACLRLRAKDLLDHELELDESRDVIDLIMNIESLEAAVLFREDGPGVYKLSLRSKGRFEVLGTAERVGGGGHAFSSGAYLTGDYDELKDTVVADLLAILANSRKNESA